MPKLLAAALCLMCLPAMADNVDFHLADLDGNPVRLSDYRGRWVVVNFWASCCTPCVAELAELSAYQAEHTATVQVLGINFEATDTCWRRNSKPSAKSKVAAGSASKYSNFSVLQYSGNGFPEFLS